jgi:tripartite-type tricarboxylate transporter receptor subunit TctC
VIAEQKVGASGMLANGVVSKAAPDIHTPHAAHRWPSVAAVLKAPALRSGRGFGMVSIVTYPMVISVAKNSPIAVSRSDGARPCRPRKITYSPGAGSLHHLLGELVNIEAGISSDRRTVRRAQALGPARRAHRCHEWRRLSIPQTRGGKIRAWRSSTAARSRLLPEVPAIAETVPGWTSAHGGRGHVAGHAAPVIDRLNRELHGILDLPDVQKRLADLGGVASRSTPAQMRDASRISRAGGGGL